MLRTLLFTSKTDSFLTKSCSSLAKDRFISIKLNDIEYVSVIQPNSARIHEMLLR